MISAMTTPHISYFKSLLDDKAVLTAQDGIDAYQHGARDNTGQALCVLRPKTTEEVSQIMAYCAREKLHLIPQSANTGLVGGATPDQSGTQIILSLERMNTIKAIDPVNASAHVGAGVHLSALNTAAEEHKLTFPIDLGSDPCIGGMVSTNTGGSRYLKYRGVRDYVMGLKAVLADENGTILDILTPLHKNNTGFDTKQLFIGSGGVFGIVTEAIIRLTALPQQSATALLIPSTPEAATLILTEIEKACGTYLSAFESMSGNAMRCALDHVPSTPNPFGQDPVPDYAILVELSRTWPPREGEQSLDEVLETVLAELWDHADSPLDNALIGPPEKLWSLRHNLSEGTQKSGKLYGFDISFKRGDLMAFRTHIQKELQTHYPDLTLCDFGHIGDGAMHCSLVLSRNDPRSKDADFEHTLRQWVNDQAVRIFGGSYSAEHALGPKVQDAYNRYTPEEIKAITRSVKDAIAPVPLGTIKI